MSSTVAAYPIDYTAIRAALANAMQLATGLVAIEEKPVSQNAPRPALPYFSFNITTPGKKYGRDDRRWVGPADTGQFVTSGARRMTISFNCYAVQKEDAFSLMTLWQGSLETNKTQELLSKTGIAVWQVRDVMDLSPLLNTGYEGRAHLEATFGLASILKVPGETETIDKVGISGQVVVDSGVPDTIPEFDVPST